MTCLDKTKQRSGKSQQTLRMRLVRAIAEELGLDAFDCESPYHVLLKTAPLRPQTSTNNKSGSGHP